MAAEAFSRRSFLRARFEHEPSPVRPPWTTEQSVEDVCTGCGACRDACPAGIIALDAANRPALDLRHAECTFCAACVDACAEPVFSRDLHPAFPHVAEIGTRCLTLSGITCRTCEDVCPERAIRFAMRLGGPAIPELTAARCTGCGACIAACPGDAIVVHTPSEEMQRAG